MLAIGAAAVLSVLFCGVVHAGSGVNPDTEDELDDEFAEEFELLQEEQVVSATMQRQTVAEAPAIIAVVTRQEMERHGYRSVAEALEAIPGVYVNYDYVFHDAGLRGISNELRGASRSIKVLINGQDVSFRAETSNFLGPELIPISAIERIEVIRGPASALYGANAFLGVVDIITRKGEQVDGTAVEVSGQLFGEAYGGGGLGLLLGKRLGPVDLLLALSHRRWERSGRKIRCTAAVDGEGPCDYVTDATKQLLGRPSFDDIARPSSFFSSLDVDVGRLFGKEPGDWGHLNLQGTVQLLDYRGSFSDWGSLNYDDITDEQGRVTGHLPASGNRVALGNMGFMGRYEVKALDDRLQLDVGANYSEGGPLDSERLEDQGGVVNRSSYGFSSIDSIARASWSVLGPLDGGPAGGFLQRLVVTGGFDSNFDRITYVPVGGSATMNFVTSSLLNLGFWGQATATLWDGRIGLTGGVRYDHHRGAGLVQQAIDRLTDEQRRRLCGTRVCYRNTSWRTGITYRIVGDAVFLGDDLGFLVDSLYLKVLAGTAFKAPSPLFLYQEDFLGERPMNPNPALLPQTVSTYEILVGSAHLKKRIEASLNFFINKIKNRAEFTRNGLAVVAVNGAPVDTWGIEFMLRVRLDRLVFNGTLSYQHSERDLGENIDDRITDTFGYPDLMATAGVEWNIPGTGLVATVDARYVGSRVGHPFNRADRKSLRYTLAPYVLLDLGITSEGWRLFGRQETKVSLFVKNLLGTTYDFPGFQPYYRYDLPGLPRTIVLAVSQQF